MLKRTEASSTETVVEAVAVCSLTSCWVSVPVVMQDSKDWKSQSQATYRSSQQCVNDPALYNERPVAGIRTQLVC